MTEVETGSLLKFERELSTLLLQLRIDLMNWEPGECLNLREVPPALEEARRCLRRLWSYDLYGSPPVVVLQVGIGRPRIASETLPYEDILGDLLAMARVITYSHAYDDTDL